MTTMEATSPLASESATLDSTSLVVAASSTGEDFLMLDTPRLDDAQPAVWECQASEKSSPVDEAASANEIESKVADSDAKGLVASIAVMMAKERQSKFRHKSFKTGKT
jgi:hypothetical protein